MNVWMQYKNEYENVLHSMEKMKRYLWFIFALEEFFSVDVSSRVR